LSVSPVAGASGQTFVALAAIALVIDPVSPEALETVNDVPPDPEVNELPAPEERVEDW
jgi:hypothetical protein